ncbi:GNAT family N-acetyltransferase [Rhizobium rhizoryzae]|uniref:GNAT family N-acetyltransferase n=1 Tax=Rhizobium rhizoryzae TaxID=451876 RepID=UPI002896BE92|nr:GNAT family N-acetyltransferase [Rhizobium rhizoryzae]
MSAVTARIDQDNCAADAAKDHGLVVSLHQEIEQVADAWRDLQQIAWNSPHQSIEWCKAWYATQADKPLFLLGSDMGKPLFVLPLAVTSSHGIRSAGFPGGSFNNINTGLFAAGCDFSESALVHCIAQIKSALSEHVDVLHMRAIPKEWQGARLPLHRLSAVEHVNHSFQLPLLGSFDETLAQINAKRRRKKFRQQTRRISELGGYEVCTPEHAGEQHELLDLFFEQKRERFRSQGLPDVFASASIQHFFHALLDEPADAENYPLRLSAIKLTSGGDRAIPAICGLTRKGNHIICQFGSIDESRVPETSPGELLFWHVIENACSTGAKLFDFGLGDQLYKRSWCPVETVHYDLMVPISGRGHLAAIARQAQIRLKSRLKRSQTIYRLLQRIRASKIASPEG